MIIYTITLVVLTFLILFGCALRYMIKNKDKNIVVLLIFITWWSAFIFNALFGNVNTYELSLTTTLLLCLGNIFFFIGYMYTYRKVNIHLNFLNIKLIDKIKEHKLIKKIPKINYYFTLQVLLMVILIYYYMKYTSLLEIYGDNMTRLLKFNVGYLFASLPEAIFYQYFITSIIQISIYYGLIKIFFSKNKIGDVLLMSINVLLFSLIGQGRFLFLQIIIIIVFLFIYKSFYDLKFFKSKIKWIILTCIIGVLGLVGMTLVRMGADFSKTDVLFDYLERIMDQAYIYFAGPFKSLDYFITDATVDGFYPASFTLRVIVEPITELLTKLGLIVQHKDPMIFMQETIYISQYTEFNALFSYYANFYFDFSYLGFILPPFIIGGFVSILTKNLKSKNIFLKMFACINVVALLRGVFRWEYQLYETFVVIFISVLLYILFRGDESA